MTNLGQGSIPVIETLNIQDIEPGEIKRYWLKLVSDGMNQPVSIPIMVAKGQKPGKVLGVTAAIHGNELNGIPVIQRLFQEIDTSNLAGTILAVPVSNVPSFLRKKRRFVDGTDLNHIMPGVENGNVSQVYAHRFVQKVLSKMNYLMDLHTASVGRVNSYYIRADLDDELTRRMAYLQNAQIIVHNPPSDGTLRGTAEDMGITAITLEVGNPNQFQKGMIRDGLTGIHNFLADFNMVPDEVEDPEEVSVICDHSYWIYTRQGGVLTVHPQVTDLVQKGERIATLRNIFGEIVQTYKAPQDGIVIGKSVNPIVQSGGRILHLGIVSEHRSIESPVV